MFILFKTSLISDKFCHFLFKHNHIDFNLKSNYNLKLTFKRLKNNFGNFIKKKACILFDIRVFSFILFLIFFISHSRIR